MAMSAMMRPGDLDELDDAQLLTMIQSLPHGDSARDAACEVLVTRYRPLVRSCVLRYRNSTEPHEELMQVGYVGLLKAINNFDPTLGASLAGYAQPCVSGEIKRHFRDKQWQVHVKRSLQELRLELRNAAAELTNELGRIPSDAELAQYLNISVDDVRAARQADLAFQAASLDSPVTTQDGSASLGELLGDEDPQLEHVLDMQAVWAHWHELPDREQQMLLMRFYGNMTQAEIGAQLGISQMHVSRLLAEALSYLRGHLIEPAAVSA
ncbi:MAG TPA: SigB/SigF/SigG family RNA polymerase sigma factor [Streptosporangiaceae bacterium]|jgi:RNA polymerase sigma-B factor|nr:SigB/SigF/SigG family RNA polymerase sigma factor [Streptosporangiaceae bacterium]